jgi:uncharacterized protein YbaP (TraB family)
VKHWIPESSGRWSAAVAVGLLAALACAQPATPPREPARPALWRVDAPAGEAGTLYLLGSVHMGSEPDFDLGPQVDDAWQRADELVVEVDLDGLQAQEIASLTRLYGTLEPPLTLRSVLSGQTLGQLDAWSALRGLDPASLAHYKPWFVSFTIVQVELQHAGYDAAHGVDRYFMTRAAGRKPVVALETVASQLQVMDRLPASLQELMLRDALARVDQFPDETAKLLEAWRRGDERQLEALVFQPLEEFPELGVFYDLVFFQRNVSMARRLAELGSEAKTRFVVIGTGHLLGAQGVPALLARRGFRVTRQR